MKKEQIDEHLKHILVYQDQLNKLGEDMKIQRIELLSKQLVFIGRLASAFSENYKQIYAKRKRMYAEAEINAQPPRQARAELAVAEIREEEAEAYGLMKRWNNAFDSTKEEINALKYKVKIDIEDGSNRQ
ncbi:hypothetical protein [Ornithinibacillus xuwenensis]|uniref:Flagellar FliJ protein n=1 Tax=Ornithinibacillus xuwenensis TaxID=3144668 RepID=A0ABU9XFX1_9BACI